MVYDPDIEDEGFKKRHQVVCDFWMNGAPIHAPQIILNVNALTSLLIGKGIISEDEMYNAKIRDVNKVFEEIEVHRETKPRSRWFNPFSWCFNG